jgi:hypothetical protein
MDLKQIVTSAETLAQDLATGAAGPMPDVQPKTADGKAGYDRMIDAMNRLPRPLMALGALGVFIVAGVKPVWFETQMQVLAAIPQPMWWLLGAVITMFFGSREAHYSRQNTPSKR